MNKLERKLNKYLCKAEACTSREEARKILKKYREARAKVKLKRMIEDD